MRALIVEDDRDLGSLLPRQLRQEGFVVDLAGSRAAGSALAAATGYELVLIDWNLPDGSGLDILAAYRGAGHSGSAVIITARSTVEDLVLGLEAGADDILTKPFDWRELRARVRALFRRARPWAREVYRTGDLVVDCDHRTATVRAKIICLTPKEWHVLRLLVRQPGRVVSRAELVAQAWDDNHEPEGHALNVHICNLRSKLEALGSDVAILAWRGAGFQLLAPKTQ